MAGSAAGKIDFSTVFNWAELWRLVAGAVVAIVLGTIWVMNYMGQYVKTTDVTNHVTDTNMALKLHQVQITLIDADLAYYGQIGVQNLKPEQKMHYDLLSHRKKILGEEYAQTLASMRVSATEQ